MVYRKWQDFIKTTINYLSHGYTFYCLTMYPEHKQNRWEKIDEKLKSKYPIYTKDVKYKRKKKGLVNFAFTRWHNYSLIFHTAGEWDVSQDDRFVHIDTNPIYIKTGEILILKIGKNRAGRSYTVFLEKTCYRDIKYQLIEAIEYRHLNKVALIWQRLNNIPGYSGIIEQRKIMRNNLAETAKKHNMKIPTLKINNKKVY
ncbi:hypothetical protein [Flexistipes sp.]|uniref:hypothetical protein n=1 Tax=Flexistipes sp. TaxID=3088135 RepID=UPI002E200102|nr:hypothetical protein [Flexistipes sp.]